MKFAKFAAVIILVAALSGCATFNNMVKNDALISQLAVEAATARVLHDHPTWKTATIRITGGAISLIDGKMQADLASVEGYVKEHVDWSRMMPEEQALVSVLISQVVQNLSDSFRAESIVKPEEQMVYVRQVLLWINLAAKRQI